MGKNIGYAKRLKEEQIVYQREVDELEVKVQRKGWLVRKSDECTLFAYRVLLDKLLASDEVVNTEGVYVYASAHFEVAPGKLFVDLSARIDDIIAFLKA